MFDIHKAQHQLISDKHIPMTLLAILLLSLVTIVFHNIAVTGSMIKQDQAFYLSIYFAYQLTGVLSILVILISRGHILKQYSNMYHEWILVQTLLTISALLLTSLFHPALRLFSDAMTSMVLLMVLHRLNPTTGVMVWLLSIVSFIGVAMYGHLFVVSENSEYAWVEIITIALLFLIVGLFSIRIRHLVQSVDQLKENLVQAEGVIAKSSIIDHESGFYNGKYAAEILNTQKQFADRGDYDFVVSQMELSKPQYAHESDFNTTENFNLIMRLLKRHTRAVDYYFRLDNGRFLVLLLNTTSAKVKKVFDRIQNTVSEIEFEGIENESLKLTVGVTDYCCIETVEELLGRSEQALDQALALGEGSLKIENRKKREIRI